MTRVKQTIYIALALSVYGVILWFKSDLLLSETAGSFCLGVAAREVARAIGMPAWQDHQTDASDIWMLVTAGCLLLV